MTTPSYFQAGVQQDIFTDAIGDANPVDQVSGADCERLLTRYRLTLPTESQWEYGCRAGTSTPWFTGSEANSLSGFANVLDRTGERWPRRWPGGEAFDDSFKGPAPVGSFLSNAFGLHDTHGNSSEWCRDAHCSYTRDPRAGDGLRNAASSDADHIGRGGSFGHPALLARSARRGETGERWRTYYTGVRPARELDR